MPNPTQKPLATNRTLDLSPEELEKVQRARAKMEDRKATPVDAEWKLIAEFGTYYGWAGVEAILNNEISIDVFTQLLKGGREVWNDQLHDRSKAHFRATAAATSADKVKVFNKLASLLPKSGGGAA
jgi:hypothetical protein